MRILYECHGHLMMDGKDYRAAAERNAGGADIADLRRALESLSGAGVRYFRDGGDRYGVSALARSIAPEYGIRVISPVFAIYKRGRYGSIVGRSCDDIDSYRKRLAELKEEGADFVKLMLSGIITFREYGELSCDSVDPEEMMQLVRIAHDEGYRVMAHVNGASAVRDAALAGVDSIEHGYFADEEALEVMAEKKTVWVPTLAAVEAFIGREGTDSAIAEGTLRRQLDSLSKAREMGIPVASGSDSGAAGVPHGRGTIREYELLSSAGFTEEETEAANKLLWERFTGV